MPLRNFSDDYHATLNGKNALTDVMDILGKPSVKNRHKLLLDQWRADSELELAQVSYGYEDKLVLKNIDIHIKGYQKLLS